MNHLPPQDSRDHKRTVTAAGSINETPSHIESRFQGKDTASIELNAHQTPKPNKGTAKYNAAHFRRNKSPTPTMKIARKTINCFMLDEVEFVGKND
jgi:hypothetical protein